MYRNNEFRTIEGDLFNALVAARAISKANANDPKKSGLTRCARTDKGVHAAGNVISLKLIVEDPDVLHNINSHLSSQIRVWGIERTTGSFSCYHACDSRWYEYLIPTFAFLPPHPNSYLGEQLDKLATEANDEEGYRSRQKEVAKFWDEVEATHILPIVDSLEGATKDLILEALYGPSKKYGITESGNQNSLNTDEAQSSSTEPAVPGSKPIADQAEPFVRNLFTEYLGKALISKTGRKCCTRREIRPKYHSGSNSVYFTVTQNSLRKSQKSIQNRSCPTTKGSRHP